MHVCLGKVFLFYESNVVDHMEGWCINHTVALSYCCCILVIVLPVGTCGHVYYIFFVLQIYMCWGLLSVSWSRCSAVEHLKQSYHYVPACMCTHSMCSFCSIFIASLTIFKNYIYLHVERVKLLCYKYPKKFG